MNIDVFSVINRQLRSHHAVVLINLCIALIIANIVFLTGANQVNNKVCNIVFLETNVSKYVSK